MKSVNKVILIGTLGRDPEVKYTPSGTAVTNFSIATNERQKDKDGNWGDRTEWHRIVCWQRLAEIAGEYLKKGRHVYIEGTLRTRSWDDKNHPGEKRYATEIWANDLVLLGGRPEGEAAGQARSASASAPAAAPEQKTPDYENSTQITDEDIPF